MIEEKLKQLGFQLPTVAKPLAAYIPAKMVGSLVLTSGQVPILNGEIKYKGKVGKDISEEDGIKAAELCVLNCLAAVKTLIGSLDSIKGIVKLTVFVNCADDFHLHPKIANGASELLLAIFGEIGKHVRSAVGVSSLPLNSAVEIEMMVEI